MEPAVEDLNSKIDRVRDEDIERAYKAAQEPVEDPRFDEIDKRVEIHQSQIEVLETSLKNANTQLRLLQMVTNGMQSGPKKRKEDDPHFPEYNKLMKEKHMEDVADMVMKKLQFYMDCRRDGLGISHVHTL